MKNQTITEWSKPLAQTIESHIERANQIHHEYSEAELTARPENGGWSAAQCFAHLNTYGYFYSPYAIKAAKQIFSGQDKTYFKSGFLGKLLTKTIQPDNKRKLKALKPNQPAADTNGAEAIAGFIAYQEKWLQLLQGITRFDQLNVRVSSSISPLIRFKLGDVFAFMITHDARHLQQADRVLAGTAEKV